MSISYEFNSEREAIKALEAEGEKLMRIALNLWRAYLESYRPKAYVRTPRTQASFKLGKVKQIDEDTLGIELTWDDDLVYHDSVITHGFPQGHSLMLISDGWHVRKGRHKDVYRFGYYEGFHYFEKLITEYNAIKHEGIHLEIQNSGRAVRRFRGSL